MNMTGLTRKQVMAAMEWMNKESTVNAQLKINIEILKLANASTRALNASESDRAKALAKLEALVPDYQERMKPGPTPHR